MDNNKLDTPNKSTIFLAYLLRNVIMIMKIAFIPFTLFGGVFVVQCFTEENNYIPFIVYIVFILIAKTIIDIYDHYNK